MQTTPEQTISPAHQLQKLKQTTPQDLIEITLKNHGATPSAPHHLHQASPLLLWKKGTLRKEEDAYAPRLISFRPPRISVCAFLSTWGGVKCAHVGPRRAPAWRCQVYYAERRQRLFLLLLLELAKGPRLDWIRSWLSGLSRCLVWGWWRRVSGRGRQMQFVDRRRKRVGGEGLCVWVCKCRRKRTSSDIELLSEVGLHVGDTGLLIGVGMDLLWH
ncbi:hypothetical protein J3F83DRAFT_704819 [Trichoderma novae-zelandiae]